MPASVARCWYSGIPETDASEMVTAIEMATTVNCVGPELAFAWRTVKADEELIDLDLLGDIEARFDDLGWCDDINV